MSTSTASQHLPAAASSRSRSRRRASTSRTPTSRTATGRTATSGTATSGARGHVHLTRRGRLLLLVALVGVLFAAFSLGRSASQAAPRADAPSPATTTAAAQQLTVQQGESLWTLAQRIAPDDDPRDVVAQLRQINDLPSSSLRPGQQLLLPRSA